MRAKQDIMKGTIAGVAGGLLASLIMEQFQALWTKAASSLQNKSQTASPEKPATVQAADAVSEQLTGHKLPPEQQDAAGEAVHYTMGAASGAIYGLVSELIPLATIGNGGVFGAAVFLLADEVSVPALGLSKSPSETPITTHAYGLASHLIYGWTTELVRAAVRKAMN